MAGPLGARRDDVLTTRTAFWIARALGASKARIDQMLPEWDRPPAMSWQDMKAVAVMVTQQHGGTIQESTDGESG